MSQLIHLEKMGLIVTISEMLWIVLNDFDEQISYFVASVVVFSFQMR